MTEELKIEYVDPAALKPSPGNPRTHPEKQKTALTASLDEFGFVSPAIVNRKTGHVLDGHLRRDVTVERKDGKIPVVFVDWDERKERRFLASFDRIGSLAVVDELELARILKEIEAGTELPPAFDDNEVAKLLAQLEQIETSGGGEEEESSIDEPEDAFDELFKAPFPWFGGKSRIARMAWKHFGEVKGYIEPFFGSGAVMLNRPQPFDGVETVNDLDGFVSNFWRAVKADPDKVAEYADWPVIENDLHARHSWLVGRKDSLQARLEGDPDYFDAKIAGWWAWGMACWIGGGFCKGVGPWQVVEDEEGNRTLVHLGDSGQGVNRKRVHLGDSGRGVNRKRVHLGDSGRGAPGLGERGLLEWMRALSERFSRTRVCCGDWRRVCGGDDGDALAHFFAGGEPVGVLLDPPYSAESDRDEDIYSKEDFAVSHDVREWAIRHGEDKRLRIALCGYEGEHKMPENWKCVSWKAHGGMSCIGGDKQASTNVYRERVWFSPWCLRTKTNPASEADTP
jgi:hypothetical protein